MSEGKTNRTLVLGIGNSSRQDDALGWRFLDFLQSQGLTAFDLEYRYQLQVEDAEVISCYEKVIFVDATKEKTDRGFYIRPCKMRRPDDLTSHSLSPESVNFLCRSLFDKSPECQIIGIEGLQFELGKELTPQAGRNLCNAQDFFIEHLFTYI